MTDDTTTEPPAGDASGDDLDGLKRALANERRQHKETRSELDRLRRGGEDHDAQVAAANARVLHAEVRAQAAGRLADPNDAVSLLDLTAFTVDADGIVDTDAIGAALDQLVASKPYLAPKQPPPHAPQHTRADASAPSGDEWLRSRMRGE
jgi:hypothetical protein